MAIFNARQCHMKNLLNNNGFSLRDKNMLNLIPKQYILIF